MPARLPRPWGAAPGGNVPARGSSGGDVLSGDVPARGSSGGDVPGGNVPARASSAGGDRSAGGSQPRDSSWAARSRRLLPGWDLRARAVPPDARRGRRWRAAVPVAAALAGLLFATSAVSARGFEPRGRRDNLPDLVTAEQRRVAALSRTAATLRAQVDAGTGAHAGEDARIGAAKAQAARLAGPVGLLPVTGRAVTVVLDDAPRGAPAGPLPPGVPSPTADDLVVHQQDVQAVVNALWAGGATAMTVMGQRVIALTAVRCVGNTLLLHGAVYSPPFTITALGDQARLRGALADSKGVAIYQQYVDAYGLGYRVTDTGSADLPGYDGNVDLPLAKPLS